MEENKRKKLKDLSIKDRAGIMMERLKEPEISTAEFSRKHNIDSNVMTRLQNQTNFSQEVAVSALLANIMKKDQDLISLSTDIKNKWADSVSKKRTINTKDIEVLDRVETTAMKRVMLVKATQEAAENDKPLDIQITL